MTSGSMCIPTRSPLPVNTAFTMPPPTLASTVSSASFSCICIICACIFWACFMILFSFIEPTSKAKCRAGKPESILKV